MDVSPRIIAASIIFGISALTLLAGCGITAPMGTLTGTFQIVTGGVEYRTVPGAGHVILRQGPRRLADHEVSSGSTFTFTLPPGPYRITSTCLQSPHETQLSAPKTVSIATNVPTRADVRCLPNPTSG
jgi:hypothetical protein